MTDTKKVLRKLLSDHVGEHNAITQSQLSEATGINTSTLRSELRRLREERNIPIANKRNGYYVIVDRSELQEFIAHINQEIQSKKNTIEHTLEAFEEFDHSEIELEPEKEVIDAGFDCHNCGTHVAKQKIHYWNDEPFCRPCWKEESTLEA